MSEIEANLLDQVAEDATGMPNARRGYDKRRQDTDVNDKLNMLFGQSAEKDKDETTVAYETVEEGMTTDTTDV